MRDWLFGGLDGHNGWSYHFPRIGLIFLPIALVPGLAIGFLAYSFGRVMRLRCRHCGWRDVISVK